MLNPVEIMKIYPDSFRANIYTIEPFRMIGLIDVSIKYTYGIERVTLAFYRSSGTYSGKILGLWYPIVGIKTHSGSFTEFTEHINNIVTNTTEYGSANKGWLVKSLFFSNQYSGSLRMNGFSNGTHYRKLLEIGESLRNLYERGQFYKMNFLDAENLNSVVISPKIYLGNRHKQRENFDRFIEDIYIQYE